MGFLPLPWGVWLWICPSRNSQGVLCLWVGVFHQFRNTLNYYFKNICLPTLPLLSSSRSPPGLSLDDPRAPSGTPLHRFSRVSTRLPNTAAEFYVLVTRFPRVLLVASKPPCYLPTVPISLEVSPGLSLISLNAVGTAVHPLGLACLSCGCFSWFLPTPPGFSVCLVIVDAPRMRV